MSQKNSKNNRINARLTDEQYDWFVKQAGSRKLKISEFMRNIPDISRALSQELDVKDDEIDELKNENIRLRAKIFSLEGKKVG